MEDYTIAWKKLFEFILKNQKEKALGIYRLLSSNFKDKALALKINGDIYIAFKDIKEALRCYESSYQLYKSYNKIKESNYLEDCINYIKNKYLNTLDI